MDANRTLSATTDYAGLSGIGLLRGKAGRISNGRGVRVRVESGAIWLTQERCAEDVILNAGDCHAIEHDGVTLLGALGVPFALVSIEPAAPVCRGFAERFWSLWAGLYAPASRPTTAAL